MYIRLNPVGRGVALTLGLKLSVGQSCPPPEMLMVVLGCSRVLDDRIKCHFSYKVKTAGQERPTHTSLLPCGLY